MAIPKFDETMLPILKVLSDERVRTVEEVANILLKEHFTLTEEEEKETVSNGYSRFFDRVSWGRTYLKKAGLLEQPERAKLKITKEGLRMLTSNPTAITVQLLLKYPSFVAFKASEGKKTKVEVGKAVLDKFSPQDMIDIGFQDISETLKSDLLEKLKSSNPYFFQKVGLILFQRMGYGDFQETPKSRDGGIDGIISQDKLGLEKIYIQAKRYGDSKVREPEIRNFIGAMSDGVNKGIFVTTSDFDDSAIEKAKTAHNHKIVLINGDQLTDLMIRHDVGVQVKTRYEVKEIDNDFFEEI